MERSAEMFLSSGLEYVLMPVSVLVFIIGLPIILKILALFVGPIERDLIEWWDRRVAKDIAAHGIKRRKDADPAETGPRIPAETCSDIDPLGVDIEIYFTASETAH